jgi:hypothetical protein
MKVGSNGRADHCPLVGRGASEAPKARAFPSGGTFDMPTDVMVTLSHSQKSRKDTLKVAAPAAVWMVAEAVNREVAASASR